MIVDNEKQADLEGSSPFVSTSSPSTLSEFSQSVLSNDSGLGEDGSLSVEVDCEITMFEELVGETEITNTTLINTNHSPNREMARSKQTMRKSGQDYNKYCRVRFGKPGGKASQHLRIWQEDEGESSSSSSNSDTSETNVASTSRHTSGNPVVKNAVKAGQRRC